jgi:hypothetical protein
VVHAAIPLIARVADANRRQHAQPCLRRLARFPDVLERSDVGGIHTAIVVDVGTGKATFPREEEGLGIATIHAAIAVEVCVSRRVRHSHAVRRVLDPLNQRPRPAQRRHHIGPPVLEHVDAFLKGIAAVA